MAGKRDSNLVNLRYALVSSAAPRALTSNPVWKELEVNSFSDFGTEYTQVARRPLTGTRQRKRGEITDQDSVAVMNIDITQNNLLEFLQGFFYAAARQRFDTKPLNGTNINITSVSSSRVITTSASALPTNLGATLALFSGFENSDNNGIKKIASVSGGSITVTGAMIAEANPPPSARIQIVGFEFAANNNSITIIDGLPRLSPGAATSNYSVVGLIPGEWVYLGGDTAASQLGSNVGYARVKRVGNGFVEFDKTTFTPQPFNGVSSGTACQIFFGTVIKNENDRSLIKPQYAWFERDLGPGPASVGNSFEAEYVVAASANQLTINIPMADKLNADISFTGLDGDARDGSASEPPYSQMGTSVIVPALNEKMYNTSRNVVRIALSAVVKNSANPSSYFGYVTEGTITVNNNVSPSKAVGIVGGFAVSPGLFDVGAELTVYYDDIRAIKAVRENTDCTFDMIVARGNAGMVYDVPLIGLGGGKPDVSIDEEIMLPLTASAAESPFGHSALFSVFPYLPNVAMPL